MFVFVCVEKGNQGANGDSNTNHFNTSDGRASGPSGLMGMSPSARSSPPLLTNVSTYREHFSLV